MIGASALDARSRLDSDVAPGRSRNGSPDLQAIEGCGEYSLFGCANELRNTRFGKMEVSADGAIV